MSLVYDLSYSFIDNLPESELVNIPVNLESLWISDNLTHLWSKYIRNTNISRLQILHSLRQSGSLPLLVIFCKHSPTNQRRRLTSCHDNCQSTVFLSPRCYSTWFLEEVKVIHPAKQNHQTIN